MTEQTIASDGPQSSDQAAEEAGLSYVGEEGAGITRRRSGKGFIYRHPNGERITDKRERARIRTLAIPPAWTDVWICPHPLGHIQATGRDARGRKQYRYHIKFRMIRDNAKFQHLADFAEALPQIRSQVRSDMARQGLPREKVIATVVNLLETTLIRIGNAGYARDNKSYGLTTLNNPHIKVDGAELRFRFKGKSGRVWRLTLKNRRVAKTVRACQELPGQQLFQYVDAGGEIRNVTSSDVNAYLRAASGLDISAKDFRTWAGTLEAAWALHRAGAADSDTEAKRRLKTVLEIVASRLGNTASICRKCYVHPRVVDLYLSGGLALDDSIAAGGQADALTAEEMAILPLLISDTRTPLVVRARRPDAAERKASIAS